MAGERSIQNIEAEGTQKCPECGSRDIDKKDNEIFCRKCGFVID